MTVDDLRAALADIPGDTPVVMLDGGYNQYDDIVAVEVTRLGPDSLSYAGTALELKVGDNVLTIANEAL